MTSAALQPPVQSTQRQWCPRCSTEYPTETCRPFKLGNDPALLCPKCGMITRAVREAPAPTAPREDPLDVWRFPVRGDAWISLLALGLGVWFVSHLPIAGFWMGFGFVAAYLFSVIVHSARGATTMPAAVDFLGWSDLVPPTVRALGSIALGLWPLWVAIFAYDRSPTGVTVGLCGLAVIFSAVWTPAAILVAAHQQGCLAAFNPVPVVRVILAIPGDYFRTVGVLAVQFAVGTFFARLCEGVTRGVASMGVFSWPVQIACTAAVLYVPVVMARTLGVMVHQRRDVFETGA